MKLVLLLSLCCLVLFNDRGMISCSSVSGPSGIQHSFNVSVADSSWVYAAAMVGLTLGSLLAGQISKWTNAMRLIGTGLAGFSLGSFGIALAPNFPLLLLCRAVVGLSSGPLISLASPLINDHSHPSKRSLSLACLFVCMPVGFAIGYIIGSFMSGAYGWRSAFILQGLLMAPFASVCLLTRTPKDIRRSISINGQLKEESFDIMADLRVLIKRPVVMLIILAVSQFNGALSSFGFYGSKAVQALYHFSPATADQLFGLLIIITGAAGTLAGGALLDALGSSVRRALMVCTASVVVAAVAMAVAFTVKLNFVVFALAAAIGESAIFLTSAPVMGALLWSTPPTLRPFALGISELCTHFMGDVPLPPLLGLVQEHTGNWRLTLGLAAIFMALAALLFGCAWALAVHQDQDGLSVVDMDFGEEEFDDAVEDMFDSGDGGPAEGGGLLGGEESVGVDIEQPLLQQQQHIRESP